MDNQEETDQQRFKRFARALCNVPKAELDAQLAKSDPVQPLRNYGPPKGTPNWRTKRKQANEQPPHD